MAKSRKHEEWFDRGIAFQDKEEYLEALNCFQKAIEIKADFIPAWVYKGITLEQLKRYEEAIASYTEAIDRNPDIADLWYNKGASLCRLRRYSDALKCFDRVLAINPHHALAQTTRLLTLAAPPNPIKTPPQTEEKEPIEPMRMERSAAIEISTSTEMEHPN